MAAHDRAKHASRPGGSSVRVLKDIVGQTAGMKFETTERHPEHCYSTVTHDVDGLASFHAGPGCMNAQAKEGKHRWRPSIG